MNLNGPDGDTMKSRRLGEMIPRASGMTKPQPFRHQHGNRQNLEKLSGPERSGAGCDPSPIEQVNPWVALARRHRHRAIAPAFRARTLREKRGGDDDRGLIPGA